MKNKINETLVISHAGILVPFFLGMLASYWVYEEYASQQTAFLPFALFIGISMSITAFPVLARIIQERNMTRKPVGILTIASAANDDVTAWCLFGGCHCYYKSRNVGRCFVYSSSYICLYSCDVCCCSSVFKENRYTLFQ